MATTTFLSNATVLVGAVDLSDQCRNVTLTVGYDQLEATSMGDTGRKYVQGLQSVEVSLEMYLSYGAAEVEATLTAALGVNSTLTISPSGTVESASNPEYTITNAFLTSFSPIASSVGDLSMASVTFQGGTFARDIV
jgi:hypothetical protein